MSPVIKMPQAIADQIREDDLYKAYHDVVYPAWDSYLRPQSVKKPPKYGTNYAAELSLLAYGYPNTFVISPSQMTEILTRLGFRSPDFQARHLNKEYGYYIQQFDTLRDLCPDASSGDLWLTSLEKMLPGWDPLRHKDKPSLDKGPCSFCGGRACDINWKFGGGVIAFVKQYHANPKLPLDKNNCVVQCDICNRSLKNRYIFWPLGNHNHGLVRAVLI